MRMFLATLIASALVTPVAAGTVGTEETGPSVSTEAPAMAASRTERIDALLDSLKAETDPDAADEIENNILALWLESDSDTIDLLMQWTLKAMERKQYPRALDFLDRIVLLDPDYIEGWNKRATVYFLLDDYGKSIGDIGKVLELEPRHFGALSGLGIIMRAMGDDERAKAAFRAALEIDPHLDNIRQELDALEAETGGREI